MVTAGAIITKYQQGFSAAEIAEEYGIGLKSVYSSLRFGSILRRTAAESNRLRFERKEKSFTTPVVLTEDQERLKHSAVSLYWGEGAKSTEAGVVDLANSDPDLLLVFLRFLREVMLVDESRLRVYLYQFEDQNSEELRKFWSNFLHIPREQFSKPYIRKNLGNNARRMPYGVAHVRYNDSRLLAYLLKEIHDLKTWAGGRAVNCSRL